MRSVKTGKGNVTEKIKPLMKHCWFGSSMPSLINRSIPLQKANDSGEKTKQEFKGTDGWLTAPFV
jgi:hypothetical protein